MVTRQGRIASQAIFCCPRSGHPTNADVNAANNRRRISGLRKWRNVAGLSITKHHVPVKRRPTASRFTRVSICTGSSFFQSGEILPRCAGVPGRPRPPSGHGRTLPCVVNGHIMQIKGRSSRLIQHLAFVTDTVP